MGRGLTGAGPETVADYLFTHDLNGNPTSQIVVTGLEDFIGDDRGFQVDRLNRLVGTAYYGSGETESTTFDRVGNREAHVNRQGETTQYTLANPANEYAAINGQAVQYDGTGNLCRDEDGRGYAYDEQNRLVRVFEDTNGNGVHDAGETVLANYAYDAFGRRVEFENLGAGTTTRYYHAGVSVIQERDAADELVRSHVNGAQYLDEHVATLEATGLRAGETSYYLLGGNFSVVGVGSADGSAVTRLEYSPAGERIGPGDGTGSYAHDADADGDVDLDDFVAYASCLAAPAGPGAPGLAAVCLAFHDANAVPARREADGHVDLEDFAGFQHCFSGAGQTPPPAGLGISRATACTPGTVGLLVTLAAKRGQARASPTPIGTYTPDRPGIAGAAGAGSSRSFLPLGAASACTESFFRGRGPRPARRPARGAGGRVARGTRQVDARRRPKRTPISPLPRSDQSFAPKSGLAVGREYR